MSEHFQHFIEHPEPPLARDDRGYYQPGNLVSVTTVLPFDSSSIPRQSLEAAAERGEVVHSATLLRDGGGSIEVEGLPPDARPYVLGYERFLEDKRPEYSDMETVVSSGKFGFAGRLDRIGSYEGSGAIFDIKTGPVSAFESLQMAAYLQAYGEGRGVDTSDFLRISIHVSNDGNYSLHRWEGEGDFNVFLKFLETHNWLVKHGLKKARTYSEANPQKSRAGRISEEISVLENPEIEERFNLLEELKEKKSECEALDKALKGRFEGVERVRIGPWLVEGKETERSYKPRPAQEGRIVRGWTTKFTRTGGKV
jgi:uncharacterized small protein (DUF1192 family)